MTSKRVQGLDQLLGWVKRSLLSSSAFLFAALLMSNAIAYVYYMILARLMSPADYGVFVTLTSLTSVLAVFMRTVQVRVIKVMGEMQTSDEPILRPFLFGALRTLLPIAAFMLLAFWLLASSISEFFHIGSHMPVLVLGLYAFVNVLTPLSRGMLFGLGRLRWVGTVQLLEPTIRIVTGLILVVWGLGTSGALFGYVIGTLAVFGLSLSLLGAVMDGSAATSASFHGLFMMDGPTLMTLMINAALVLLSSVDQLAVKHFFSAEIAGNYAVAFLLGKVIAMSVSSLSWVLFARSANGMLEASKRTQLFLKGLLIIGAIAVSLTLGFLIVPRLIVGLMGGPQYDTAYAYVGLVGIEMTIFAFVYLQAFFLMAVGKTRIVWPLVLAIAVAILLLGRFNTTVEQILMNLILVMGCLLLGVSLFTWRTLRRTSGR